MATSEAHILDLDTHSGASKPVQSSGVNRPATGIALALLAVGFVVISHYVSYSHAFLFLVTGIMGVALYHAHFGFTSSFRSFIVSGRGIGLRAQMIMFALVNVLFLPVLLSDHVFGHAVKASVSPIGLSVLVGSFLFGIGMQLGDGCASGTLYHTGGGDARGILTIIGFVGGSLLGTVNYAWWMKTPHVAGVSFIKSFGPLGGLLFSFLLMAIVFLVVFYVEKRRNGHIEPLFTKGRISWKALFKGPWTWVAGGIVLAVGNFVLLVVSGKPWGVTSAFALWGAKVAQGVGIHVTNWGYWQSASNLSALHESLLQHLETTDDIALMIGALLAAALGGMLPKRYFRKLPLQMVIGILIGGILMGYGARIAFGCNIGAYFSGIASFSLHGWEWFVGAMLGSVVGVALRPACKLRNR